jgi:hypothetical protein
MASESGISVLPTSVSVLPTKEDFSSSVLRALGLYNQTTISGIGLAYVIALATSQTVEHFVKHAMTVPTTILSRILACATRRMFASKKSGVVLTLLRFLLRLIGPYRRLAFVTRFLEGYDTKRVVRVSVPEKMTNANDEVSQYKGIGI